MKTNCRGDITLLLIAILTFGGGIFVGIWRPSLLFKRKPPTVELAKAMADQNKLKKDEADKRAQLEAKTAEEKAKTDSQVQSAQAMAHGGVLALARVPAEHQVLSVKLMGSFLTRAEIRLVAIRGGKQLDPDLEDEIVSIVEGALSAKQAEVDAALAKLDKSDAGFKQVTVEKEAIAKEKEQIAVQLATISTQKATVDKTVTDLTVKVADDANKLDAEQRKSGSLGAAIGNAWFYIKLAIAGIVALGALALYLKMGLGSVGKALHPLQKELSPEVYSKVVNTLDGETDKLHQWLIRMGRQAVAKTEAVATPPKPS